MDVFRTLIEEMNVNILAIAYRGYSESDGYPEEHAMKNDTEGIVNFLKNPPADIAKLIDKRNIFV